MKIVTWNVNSVNVRLPNILKYLHEYKPERALAFKNLNV
jgi:exonuclease III